MKWQVVTYFRHSTGPPALGGLGGIAFSSRFDSSLGKIFIAVDSDVNPDSMDAVLWALSYSMQPHRDVEIIRGKLPRLDPSISPNLSEIDRLIPTERVRPHCSSTLVENTLTCFIASKISWMRLEKWNWTHRIWN